MDPMRFRQVVVSFLMFVLLAVAASGCLVRTHNPRPRRGAVVVRPARGGHHHHDNGRHRGHQRGRGNPHRNH